MITQERSDRWPVTRRHAPTRRCPYAPASLDSRYASPALRGSSASAWSRPSKRHAFAAHGRSRSATATRCSSCSHRNAMLRLRTLPRKQHSPASYARRPRVQPRSSTRPPAHPREAARRTSRRSAPTRRATSPRIASPFPSRRTRSRARRDSIACSHGSAGAGRSGTGPRPSPLNARSVRPRTSVHATPASASIPSSQSRLGLPERPPGETTRGRPFAWSIQTTDDGRRSASAGRRRGRPQPRIRRRRGFDRPRPR